MDRTNFFVYQHSMLATATIYITTRYPTTTITEVIVVEASSMVEMAKKLPKIEEGKNGVAVVYSRRKKGVFATDAKMCWRMHSYTDKYANLEVIDKIDIVGGFFPQKLLLVERDKYSFLILDTAYLFVELVCFEEVYKSFSEFPFDKLTPNMKSEYIYEVPTINGQNILELASYVRGQWNIEKTNGGYVMHFSHQVDLTEFAMRY